MKKKVLKFPILAILIIMLCFSAFTGCGKLEDDPTVNVLSLNTYELSMNQYNEAELKAYLPASLKGEKVVWSTSDSKKVTVTSQEENSQKAILTSLDVTNSAVKITAECGTQKAVCKVSVISAKNNRSITISVDGETVTNETMEIGQTMQLTGVFKDEGNVVTGVPITFVSNDNSRVTVTPTGLVIAISRGNAVIVSANATYKGQAVTSRVIVTVKDETKDNISFEFMKEPTATRASTIQAYTGDVVALGFKSGEKVVKYSGVVSDFGVSGSKPSNAIFNKNIITSDDNDNLVSKYDKVVFDCSFTKSTGLPYMNFWLGGVATKIELPYLTGGVAVAFYNPKTQTQASNVTANTVYTCVIDLLQMDRAGKANDFGFAFVPDQTNKTESGEMYISNAVACTDYVYSSVYGFPTPSGKITKGSYLCFAEVGGYANVPSSSDIAKETTGKYQNWSKIDYERSCPINLPHTHNGDGMTTNPICNRIMPMLPSIGKWAASLGGGGYWNYDFWGLDIVLKDMPVGAFLNSKKDTPEGGKGVVITIRSGYRDFGITTEGYIVSLNTKEGLYEDGELVITDESGKSMITLDTAKNLYKVNLEVDKVYTLRVALKKGNDSYGIGVYSTSAGSWYANNPYFEKK